MFRYFTRNWVIMLSDTGMSRLITETTVIIMCIEQVDITSLISTPKAR